MFYGVAGRAEALSCAQSLIPVYGFAFDFDEEEKIPEVFRDLKPIQGILVRGCNYLDGSSGCMNCPKGLHFVYCDDTGFHEISYKDLSYSYSYDEAAYAYNGQVQYLSKILGKAIGELKDKLIPFEDIVNHKEEGYEFGSSGLNQRGEMTKSKSCPHNVHSEPRKGDDFGDDLFTLLFGHLM